MRSPEECRGEKLAPDHLPQEQAQVPGHIPGAANIPWARAANDDGTFKSADELRGEFANLLAATPLDRVVHYCGSGVTACHNLLAMEIAGLSGSRLYPGSWKARCSDPRRPIVRT